MSKILDVIVKSNVRKFTESMGKSRRETAKMKAEILSYMNVLGALSKKMIKATNYTDQYVTSVRLLKTTLGDTEKVATKFVNRLSEMSGLDETTLTNTVAKFSQLGKSINLSNEYSEKFAENLTVLSTKLAMLYNVDYTVMAKNVQKAIQGTQTTLKTTTGIMASDLNMQAILTENGIDRQVSSLNKAEQSIVRYSAILKQVTNDNKVYQDSVNSLAWQKQMLTAQVKRLATAIGQLLTPVFTTLFTVLNAIVMVMTEIIKIIGSLFGITIDTGKSVSKTADSYDDLSTAIGGASATAKKSLRAFDKLNNITTPSARRWRWRWSSRNR